MGGSRPQTPRGGRAGDGNNNAGAVFGGAPTALRAAGVVVPIPGPAPAGDLGGGSPPGRPAAQIYVTDVAGVPVLLADSPMQSLKGSNKKQVGDEVCIAFFFSARSIFLTPV